MPYPRLTLTQRIAQAVQDAAAAQIHDSTTGSTVDVTMLETSPLRVIAYVAGGAAFEEDGYIDWIALNSTPWGSTADGTATGWGQLKGVTREPATAAVTTRGLSGPAGAVIPAGAVFSLAGGGSYATTGEVTLGLDGNGTVALLAIAPGAAGNAPAGASLLPTLTLTGVTVQGNGPAATGGADIEPFTSFRARYLAAYSRPPQGGAASDYVQWARAVPGVTRAWCLPHGLGVGTVVVYTMWDDAEAAHGGFPQGVNGVAALETRGSPASGEQAIVANAIFPLRPVGALVYSLAATPYPVGFTVVSGSAVLSTVRSAVQAALVEVFTALADPLGGVLDASPFISAMTAVPGMPRFTLTGPDAEFAAPIGALPELGDITWNVPGG